MPESRAYHGDSSAEDASIAYLDQFAQLDGSVPDLAATLTTQAEQDAEDANLSFLREEFPEDDEEPRRERHEVYIYRRPARDAVLLGDTRDAWTQYVFGDRAVIDRSTSQQYQGWAPGASDDEDEGSSLQSTVRIADQQILRRVESQNLRDRMRNRLRRDQIELEAQLDGHLSSRRNPRIDSSEADIDHRLSYLSTSDTSTGEHPPRSSVQLTSLRRPNLSSIGQSPVRQGHLQSSTLSGNGPATSQVERHVSQEELAGGRRTTPTIVAEVGSMSPNLQRRALQFNMQRQLSLGPVASNTERQRVQPGYQEHLFRPNYPPIPDLHHFRERGQDLSTADRRANRNTASSADIAPKGNVRSIEKALRYLERLRSCESDEEGRLTAEDNGFTSDEQLRLDFLIDISKIPSPPQSSWLEIGSVLSGTQNAICSRENTRLSVPASGSPATSTPPYRFESRIRRLTSGASTARTTSPVRRESSRARISPEEQELLPQITQDHRHWINTPADERWPVKVTFHGISYGAMTLSGTMEAFNVPDKSSPTRESSITTFLEGEIIDFQKHTLETKSYKADAKTDAVYWRKLPPFCHLKDDETMIKNLLSKDWLRYELMEKWILMRWKEKCFVTPSDAESSLTISGFYYVSLRRSNGLVEGLYYDPSSAPYQHLVLKPERKMFPSYVFQ